MIDKIAKFCYNLSIKKYLYSRFRRLPWSPNFQQVTFFVFQIPKKSIISLAVKTPGFRSKSSSNTLKCKNGFVS